MASAWLSANRSKRPKDAIIRGSLRIPINVPFKIYMGSVWSFIGVAKKPDLVIRYVD